MKIKCQYCDRDFNIKPSKAASRKFCSWECRQNYNKKYKNIKVECKTCGKKISLRISELVGYNNKFCSRECFHKWHHQFRGEKHWSFKEVPIQKCELCKKEYRIPKSRLDKTRFCSEACKRSVVEKKYGGRKAYNKYHGQRRKAMMRKGGKLSVQIIQEIYEKNIRNYGTLTCIYCLKPIVFGNDSLEHKQPLIKGGTNKKTNLAVACKNCNSAKRHKTEAEYRRYCNEI